MPRMRLRSIYDEGEPTLGEGIQRGLGEALGYYAQRRETARQEGNAAGAAGGVRLPDAPQPSIRQRLGGIGRRIGEVIHGSAGGPPQLEPTGTFAPSRYPGERPFHGDFVPDEERGETPGMPDPDDIVTGAITGQHPFRKVVPPMGPVGALPPSPRILPGGPTAPMGGPNLAVQNGLPTISAASPERTYEYQGADNSRYRMPQTGERERSNRMLEYGAQIQMKDAMQHRSDEEKIKALVDGGMSPTEARARVLNNVVRYDDEYGQQRSSGALTYEERANLERLKASLRVKVANGTATSQDRQKLRELQERRLGLDERKFQNTVESGAARVEATTAATEARGIPTNPRDRRALERNPAAKAEVEARQQRVDAAIARARSSADRARNRVADRATAAARARSLKAEGHTPADIARIMQAEGFRVQAP